MPILSVYNINAVIITITLIEMGRHSLMYEYHSVLAQLVITINY